MLEYVVYGNLSPLHHHWLKLSFPIKTGLFGGMWKVPQDFDGIWSVPKSTKMHQKKVLKTI